MRARVFLCTRAHTYSNITIAPFVFVPACIIIQTDNMAGAFEALLEREPTYTLAAAAAAASFVVARMRACNKSRG